MSAGASTAKCVGSRVDYLQIAFRVDFSAETLLALRHRVAAAKEHGGNIAEIIVGRLVAEMRVPRDGGERYAFRNGDLRGLIGLREAGGWSVEFHVRASYLASHRLDEAVTMCEQIAASLGTVDGRRLRRIDLAADFTGFPLDEAMSGEFVKPRRGKLGMFEPERHDPDADWISPERRTFMVSTAVTGFAVCPGNDASARIYDKTAELQLSGREEKREIERSRWTLQGWNDGDQVTRVEFQLRGVALDELDMREPTAKRLAERIDPVWQYLTRDWLRLVVNDASRRSRCSATAPWREVQGVTFVHANAEPSTRTRRRGGATHEQAIGAMLSSLHGVRLLPRILRRPDESEGNATRELTKEEHDAYLRSLVLDMCVTAGMHWSEHLQKTHGIAKAATVFATKSNATWARFWQRGDTDMPGRWTVEAEPDGAWHLRYIESTGSAALSDLLDDERAALQSV